MQAKVFIIMMISAVGLSACLAGVLSPTQASDSLSTVTVGEVTAVITSAPAPTQTASPKPGSEWEGEWQIHVAGNENEWDGKALFEVNGLEVTGAFDLYDPNVPGLHYTVVGDLAGDYLKASGSWQLINGGTGDFYWQLFPDKPDRFVGNLDTGKFAFCGWRAGSSRPSPCKTP
jgi:hypothetical protein